MSLILGDKIRGATKARPFRPGYEPDFVRKAAEFVNADETVIANEPDRPVAIGDLSEGDSFAFADGSGHGIVTGAATGLAMTRINDGNGDRYIAATTPVIRSAPHSSAP